MEDTVTKPSTAQRLEPLLAITVVEKDMSPRIVPENQKLKLATSVIKKATFRVIARKLTRVRVGTVVKSATNAERSATLLVTVPVEVLVAVSVAAAAAAVTAAVSAAIRPVTLAVVSDTFLVTAARVRSVTTVLDTDTSVGTAPSPRDALATLVARKDISLVTVPTRVRRKHDDSPVHLHFLSPISYDDILRVMYSFCLVYN